MNTTEQARKYLNDRSGKRKMISEDTGLNYQTLNSFANGRTEMPGAALVEKLLEHRDAYIEEMAGD